MIFVDILLVSECSLAAHFCATSVQRLVNDTGSLCHRIQVAFYIPQLDHSSSDYDNVGNFSILSKIFTW